MSRLASIIKSDRLVSLRKVWRRRRSIRTRIDNSENPTNRSFVGRLSMVMDDDNGGSMVRKADGDEECDDGDLILCQRRDDPVDRTVH